MRKNLYLVWTDDKGEKFLCEGGVYTDDKELLRTNREYCRNNLDRAQRDLGMMATDTYSLVDNLKGVFCLDREVISSLCAWQLFLVLGERMCELRDQLSLT